MGNRIHLEDSIHLQIDTLSELTKALETLLLGYERKLDNLVDTLIENAIRDKDIINALTAIMATIHTTIPGVSQTYARFCLYRRRIYLELPPASDVTLGMRKNPEDSYDGQ